MSLHTIAWYESLDPAAAYNALTAVVDPSVRTSGDDVLVPDLSLIVAAMANISNGANARARITSPTLRSVLNPIISPVNQTADAASEPLDPPRVMDRRRNPIKVTPMEPLNVEVFADPNNAQIQSAIMWLSDKPIEPVTGDIYTIRATNTTTLTTGTWTNGVLTFDEDLPRGIYTVVGMRAQSAGLLAARLVPIGGIWRPGCPGVDVTADQGSVLFREGNMGAWFDFDDLNPPSCDFLSVSADTSQFVYIDLIQKERR